MKKFISTSLAFLCIMTSSASFPNKLSAIENKSNIKFYLKSASSILCTILPAFIANAIFKPRSELQTSIIPEKKEAERKQREEEEKKKKEEARKKQEEARKQQEEEARKQQEEEARKQQEEARKQREEEERKKQEEARKQREEEARKQREEAERKKQEEEEEKESSTATNQTSITEHTDPQISIISKTSKSSSSISLTESTVPTAPCNSSSDCHPKSQAALAQVIVAEKFKPLAKKATANIVELSENDLAQQNNPYCGFLINNTSYSSKNYAKYIKYVCLGNLIKKDVSKDNFYRTIYKYNGCYYRILGCYGVDSMNKPNTELLNTNLLSFNESVYKKLETYFENSQSYKSFVVSLLPYNNFKNTSL